MISKLTKQELITRPGCNDISLKLWPRTRPESSRTGGERSDCLAITQVRASITNQSTVCRALTLHMCTAVREFSQGGIGGMSSYCVARNKSQAFRDKWNADHPNKKINWTNQFSIAPRVWRSHFFLRVLPDVLRRFDARDV